MSLWPFITNFGDATLMLPSALVVGVWLALGSGMRGLLLWFGLFAAACLLTAATKIVFFGWGLGSRELSFTGISGHSMQAASVLPMLAWLLSGLRKRRVLAFWLGAAAAVLVAYSRVRLGYHSPAEAISGTVLGLAVAALCLRLLPEPAALPPVQGRPLALSLLLPLLLVQHGEHAPTHTLMQKLGTLAAGNDRPYSRADLHAQAYSSIN
ncbi:phosphatase PAP2 family protein [Pseudomonas oryzihabitans]|uniref:Membrane-associated phospholipid phosphatase n=1 Tax=Pseudomonas oryzihabitans TaxID=47885 RepID=A0AAJ2BP21_9PSED|nr:phosphatase PAP2 family protein [Pseudomonas psychrotolerans]MDR6233979.1 membrane-associated phospholipid phosphatase [Pseudomonas psychrotolerans]MDR6356935.1 membrane-associated phospholipid phosphatase [Pseudomonas psychrotolerans]